LPAHDQIDAVSDKTEVYAPVERVFVTRHRVRLAEEVAASGDALDGVESEFGFVDLDRLEKLDHVLQQLRSTMVIRPAVIASSTRRGLLTEMIGMTPGSLAMS
jgi:hypothetical protein